MSRHHGTRGALEPAPAPLAIGQRVEVFIPKRTALGALCDEEGFARRRMATVMDPQDGRRALLRFTGGLGDHDLPRAWVRP